MLFCASRNDIFEVIANWFGVRTDELEQLMPCVALLPELDEPSRETEGVNREVTSIGLSTTLNPFGPGLSFKH